MSKQVVTKTGAALIKDMLDDNKEKFGNALQNNIDPGHFIRAALTMIQENPKLVLCSMASLYSALLKSAQLSLSPDGILGQAYLVPYKQTAQLIIGYRGLRELALRTGQYEGIYSRAFYNMDEYEFEFGSNEHLKHVPYEGDPGAMRGAYAIAITKTNKVLFDSMYKFEIEKHRDQYAKGLVDRYGKKTDSAWNTSAPGMWCKTVLIRLCKTLQMSVVARQMMNREDLMNHGLDLPPLDDEGVIDITTDPSSDEPDPTEDTEKKDPDPKDLEAILNKKNGDKDPKQPAVVEDDETVDLRIVIQEGLEADFPDGDWQDRLDSLCRAEFGTLESIDIDGHMYTMENLHKDALKHLYKRMQGAKPEKKKAGKL